MMELTFRNSGRKKEDSLLRYRPFRHCPGARQYSCYKHDVFFNSVGLDQITSLANCHNTDCHILISYHMISWTSTFCIRYFWDENNAVKTRTNYPYILQDKW